ncbi:lipoxygenase homology domain-containing protein 1-like [Physella acuta]|uniref:lipoxygenase homology domain-containing protein 1-like n=1 Tax=Physella acuta TaxID=109671 RepID=UPI0027DB55B5|nr:lipoxygenase homology domain-containing protein 1-like [Physella acuta]XP_059165224.1 lipoxygenase homology domain-containing protein 1-like [Physella acuta]
MMMTTAFLSFLCMVTFIQPGIATNSSSQQDIDYTITIKTGDRRNSGTDATVFITLFGSRGSSNKLNLPNQVHNTFERGDTDTFTVHVKNVGRIQSIEIGHNNAGYKPGWFLDYVEITQKVAAVSDTDIRNGTTDYRFELYNWICCHSLIRTIHVKWVDVHLD